MSRKDGDLIYTVWGDCVPKGRPRFTKRGHAYTPKATRDYASKVRREVLAEGAKPQEGALKVSITFTRAYLKSWTKKQRRQAEAGELHPTTRPDLDNYAKNILDALNGVCWNDDAQIVELVLTKRYGEEPKVQIKVEPSN